MKVKVNNTNTPQWAEVVVKSTMPPGLCELQEIAYNLWWVWKHEAAKLFREVDPELWSECGHNPVLLLETVPYQRLKDLTQDSGFMNRLRTLYAEFRAYMDTPVNTQKPSVAYFSMEYGLTDILKIYSGGLGVLAGDYLKEASDCNINMTAVGFLYRNGYFTQELSMEGQQIAKYEPQDFNTLPLVQVKDANGDNIVLVMEYPGYKLFVNVWKVAVGRVSLYLMDTDNALNSEFDRQITAQLYGGDWENRLKQEYLLGIGGMQLLNTLGIKKQVYHCNEGHAALINAQRLVDLVQQNQLTFTQALEVVRASGLYTVHTPVPAGHDSFEEDLFAKYMSAFPAKLGISWQEFIDLGREEPGTHEKFSMSVFACNCCQEVNGVSWLHGKVSQEMFNPIWKGYFPEELHVNYVTNGVHMPSWTASEWQKLYSKTFGPEWWSDQSNAKHWEKIYQVSDQEVWETRQVLKQKLFEYVRAKYKENWLRNQGDPTRVVSILEKMNPNILTIGFGRRFATYKRAHLLFMNLERLSKIVNNPQYPVQFLFTGKAHPADGGGQGLIKRIMEISKMPEFQGKVIFLENYDMALARRLVSGVDIWLNTPTRPLEASGTSGEKAQMNGVLNFSVLDGWWLEGYEKGAGWALTDKITYENPEFQDQLDAATIYSMLENEIIPLYYSKAENGFSPEWIMYIKNSIAKIAPKYTTKRMLDDYLEKFYTKLADRSALLKADNFKKAIEIAAWKEKVAGFWDSITVQSTEMPENFGKDLCVGQKYQFKVTLKYAGIDPDLGVELVINNIRPDGKRNLTITEFDLLHVENDLQTFGIEYTLNRAGHFTYAVRVFPKNVDLPHRQDFCYVKWII
ncbi:MAG TPA: alpha-glucan family phosphorylase [Bacteroidales bacterium]|nr:alpha-glucan family phosphorylase [Bacteroidales bacterium]